MSDTVVRAVKFRVDPKALSASQKEMMEGCAGASRAFWDWDVV